MDLYAGLITRNPVSTADFKAKIASIEHFGGRGGRNEVVGASSAEGRSAEVVTGWARIVGARDGCFHAAQLNRGINAPENANYAAPFTMGDLTIVSHSRLDNREELFVQLEIANESRSVLPDYAIILHAWMKWGAECVHKFRGDWSFVIYDENTGDMHMAVDYIAGYEVYYAVEKGQISFSNHLKAAVQLKSESAIVDEKFILNRLMIHRMEDPVTGLNDVFKVAPGHLITISKDLKITKKRYWFPDHLTKLATSSDDEIIAEFLQIYETAVRRRIQPGYKIGSHLSGGLDSGSVSWLASKVLKSEERPLLGLTGTELFDTSASLKGRGNEEQYAQITAAATGHIEQLSFKCEGVSIIDSIRHEITRSLNLSHGVGNIFWIHAISKFAKGRGLDTILVGQVGNASVTWAGKGGKNYIKKEILNLIDTIKLMVLVRDKTVFELDVYPFTFFLEDTKMLLNPEFMQRHTLKALHRFEKDSIDAHRPSWVHTDRMKLLNFRAAGIGSFWEMMSIDFGIYHWDPTADQDLVEFCLRLPERYYARNGGRNLVRRSFKGNIPDEVLYKKLKGRQSSDWMIRFSHELPKFYALLDSIPDGHLFRQYINVESFRTMVQDWEKEFRATGNLGHPILSGTISRVLGLYFLLEASRQVGK